MRGTERTGEGQSGRNGRELRLAACVGERVDGERADKRGCEGRELALAACV